MDVAQRSTRNTNGGRGFDSHRGQKDFFFASCGSLLPFTRANAQWIFMGLISTLIHTSELILCSTKYTPSSHFNKHGLRQILRYWQTRTHCYGHSVADTNVSPFARARNICRGHKKCFWFCSETFSVRNKCFPVCAAQETSWATTMCPQQCVLVCQYLYTRSFILQ